MPKIYCCNTRCKHCDQNENNTCKATIISVDESGRCMTLNEQQTITSTQLRDMIKHAELEQGD
jgi:hypothetical protein